MIEVFYPADFWINDYLGNTVENYTDAFLIFIGLGLIFFIIDKIVQHRLRAFVLTTKSEVDDAFLQIMTSLRPPFYWFFAFYIGVTHLSLHPYISRGIFVIVVIWFMWQMIQAMQVFVDYLTKKALGKKGSNEHTESAIKLLSGVVKFGIWGITFILILANFGIDVTSLIAGVGIGGIAIAFAVKGILEDLFSSFSIYFDKPFLIGDTIDVGGEKGIVKRIGIKTTRLKSLATGEQLIFSNKQLTSDKIKNYRRMEKRRVSFTIGVTYQTSTTKLKNIPALIKKVIEAQEHAEFQRTHFRSFDDSALSFRTLYFMDTKDYDLYLDVHQEILFAIRQVCEKKGIEFAYPTQTLHVVKG